MPAENSVSKAFGCGCLIWSAILILTYCLQVAIFGEQGNTTISNIGLIVGFIAGSYYFYRAVIKKPPPPPPEEPKPHLAYPCPNCGAEVPEGFGGCEYCNSPPLIDIPKADR